MLTSSPASAVAQYEAPAAANLPAVHSVQVVAPGSLAFPASHSTHSVLSVFKKEPPKQLTHVALPGNAVYWPSGQREQDSFPSSGLYLEK